MITEKFVLSEKYPDCTLTTYIHENIAELNMPQRRAIIVCPGGGYEVLCDREGEPVALQYFAAGLNVFVLHYSIGEKAAGFTPLIESALAIKHIRENAAKYFVDPNYVFITGFSAGGHLSASCGTLWNIPEVREALGDAPEGIGKPTGTVLCYPVISSGKYGHLGSFLALCGKRGKTASKEELDVFSLELHVDETTSPSFIWATATDNLVPVQNSILYATALANKKIPFEIHVYPTGVHGLSLCNKETWVNLDYMLNPVAEDWINQAIRWIKEFKK